MRTRQPTPRLIGHAGEHFVIYELYRRGFLAALAPFGTDTSDVLVLDADGQSAGCALQVKTRSGGGQKPRWIMHRKHETLRAARLLYAFVDVGRTPPETFIVPSHVVADAVTRSHAAWLAGTPTRGDTRKDTAMRNIAWQYSHLVDGYPPGWLEEWRGRWDLIDEAVT